MRVAHLFLILIAPGFLPSARAATADQHITAVTVFPDRARVTRTGTVTLTSGVQTVVFDHLPLNLEEDSVRAAAVSRGSMKILGIEMRRDYQEAPASDDLKKLQASQTKLEDQIRALTDEQGNLGKRNEFLDQIRNHLTTTAPGPNDKEGGATNIQAIFTMYAVEGGKITDRLREIDFSLRDLNKQHDALASQLALRQAPAQPNTRSALVTIDGGSAGGPAEIQVSYMIADASWQPQYDAYANPDTQVVEMTYYGVVRQATGEDWNGVTLTLSTSRPSVAARLPEMTPWTIDFVGAVMPFQGPLAKASAANTTSQITAAAASMHDAAPAAMAPVPMALSQIQSLGSVATFVVPAKTTIPTDNQPHRNAISVQTLKGKWTYEASPKLADGAYLKSRVTNSSSGPLLGGEINIFLGNNFVGKSNIGLVAANASFDLFLGADDNIKMTRTEGVSKEETAGILTRERAYHRSYVIEVQNFKATDVALELHDQIPVSKNGDITVHVRKVEPEVKTQDAETGKLTWEITMHPQEKQKFTVEYEVDAPIDKPVVGL